MNRFFINFLLFIGLPLIGAEQETIKVDGLADPSTYINGYINAISGSFIYSFPDITVDGPEPLSYMRNYCSSFRTSRNLGYGFTDNHARYLEMYTGDGYSANLQTSGGDYLHFFAKKSKGTVWQYIHMPSSGAGVTNTCSGEPSGKTNLINMKIEYTPHADKRKFGTAIVHAGDGGKKYFLESGRLKYERCPSGNLIYYQYNNSGLLERIYSTDNTSKTVFGWINLDYKTNSSKDLCKIHITASNGKEATYLLKKHQIDKSYSRFLLESMVGTGFPKTNYEFKKMNTVFDRSNYYIDHFMKSISHAGCNQFSLSYDDGRVSSVSKTFNSSDEYKIFEITYEYFKTKVKDIYGGKLSYLYDTENRIREVHRYLNGQTYSSNCFLWAKTKYKKVGKPDDTGWGNLILKGIADRDNNILNVIYYSYDLNGNVIKETLAGHLTGNQKPKIIKIKSYDEPVYNGSETYSIKYTYSQDGFNNKLSQEDDDGTLIRYSYLPDTDRLIKKLTYANNQIIQREFFDYDKFKIMTRHICDDGNTEDVNDLMNVTKRMITEIVPNISAGTSGFGKPLTIIEKYWDFEFQREQQLRRIEYTYGIYDLMAREEIYDSNDCFGYSKSYFYDNAGNCIEHLDEEGYTTLYQYDNRNNCISKEKIGSDVITRYTYNGNNKLIKTEEHHASGECFVTSIKYDLLDRKVLERDLFGNETKFTYDKLGRMVETKKPSTIGLDGKLTTPKFLLTYNIWDQVISEVDPARNYLLKSYNCRGQITSKTFPDGSNEQFRYQLNGILQKKTLRNGTYALLSYDERKNLISEDTFSRSGEFLRKIQFNYKGPNLVSTVDAMGNLVEYKYDGAGRKIEEIHNSDSIPYREEYGYDTFGRLSKVTKWNAGECIVELKSYDVLNRVVEERLEDGHGNIYSKKINIYDINGNCIESIDFISQDQLSITSTKYTSFNMPLMVTDPLGNQTHYTYDFNHKNEWNQTVLEITQTDPNGVQTITIKDTHNRDVAIQKKNSLSQLLSSEKIIYDIRGLKVQHECDVIENNNCLRKYIVKWTHDSLGRPLTVIEDPKKENKQTEFSYTSLDSVASKTMPDGTVISFLYDDLGREISIKSSDGSIDYLNVYDLNNHLLESIDNLTQTSLIRKYDQYGNLIEEVLPNQCQLKFQYDLFKRMTQVTLPDQSLVEYTYGSVDMVAVAKITAEGHVTYSHTYDQTDWKGKSISSALITGDKVNFKWDEAGKFKSMHCSHISQEIPDGGYDSAGNILTTIYSSPYGNHIESYKYDYLNQIIDEDNVKKHNYQYDSLHNRLRKDASKYSINRLNQIEYDGHVSYTYDQNGNLTVKQDEDGNIQYQYDAMNRLKSVFKEREWMIESAYDSFGRRISSTRYEWNDEWKISEHLNYFYQGIHEIGAMTSNHDIRQLRILGKREGAILRVAIAIEIDKQIFAPIYDHRFNVISLVDFENHQVKESYRYSAFGEVSIFDQNGDFLELSQIGNPWLFCNKRYDPETKLYYFGNRYYCPEVGRWITKDPADFADGMNLYAYTHNSALNCIDYFGFITQQVNPGPSRPCLSCTAKKVSNYFRNFVNRIGRGVEGVSFHVLPAGPLQYFGEGVGLVLQGKSFIHQNSWSSGIRHGVVGQNKLPNGYNIYATGICTTEEACREKALEISNMLGGVEVYYICHVGRGAINDLFYAAAELMGFSNKAIKFVATDLMTKYNSLKEVYGDDFTINYIPHSRGGLELYEAAKYLPKEVKEHIEAYTLGSAKLIPLTTFKYAKNYANEKDCVHRLAKFLNNDTSVDIQYTGLRSNSFTSFIDDHLLDSSGYKESIAIICNKILEKHGDLR